MKILVCGANGQLGNECRVLAPAAKEHTFIFTDVAELNICDERAVHHFIEKEKPDVVLNCAAYTAVDKAESEQEKAFDLNRNAVKILAQACFAQQVYFIHTSTDYVFDGLGQRPYLETDPAAPASVYGASKWAGEQAIFATGGNAMIIRTAWLYSSFGNNFVKTMLRLAREKGEVSVVNDQYGSPTYARDLAHAIINVIPESIKKPGVQLYHFVDSGITTWYDFARAIFELSGIPCVVHPVTTAEFPTATKRPQYSVLDTQKFTKDFKYDIPSWKNSLADCVRLIHNT